MHSELGQGLMKSVYHMCLNTELENMGVNVRSEVHVPIIYNGEKVSDEAFRID